LSLKRILFKISSLYNECFFNNLSIPILMTSSAIT
jgi:hypothetical protein